MENTTLDKVLNLVFTTLDTTTTINPDTTTTTPPITSTTTPPITTHPLTTPNDSVPILPDMTKCNYYIIKNQTEYFSFSNPYGGIPQNLLVNFICWTVLILLFAVLRRAAGNYGRLALIRKDDVESKWTQVFFSHDDTAEDNMMESQEEEIMSESESLASINDWTEVDKGYLSWILSIFTLSDDKILRKCGTDALQYIKFQRHLIFFVFIITIICLTVILPINFTMGGLQGDETRFGHTTISNLNATDPILWVHIIIAILFMPMGVLIMRRFSVSLRVEEEQCVSSRSLMIDGIPKPHCLKDTVIRHLQEAYPNMEIEDVQIAYDVSSLSNIDQKLKRAREAIHYSEKYNRKNPGKVMQIYPHCCGLMCGLFSCCPSNAVNADEFYRVEEEVLLRKFELERSQIKTIGIAFVTFSNLEDAETVYKDHAKSCFPFRSHPPTSTIDNLLRPNSWDVTFAPPPEDIYWENLHSPRPLRIVKVIVINIILFVILFFFTSPTYIISLLETLPFLNFNSSDYAEEVNLPSYITDFLPTLLLWTLSALLPVIVAYTDWWLGHWRRSVENLWIMRKVFGYLLFMVLILPSIGLTTMRAFVETAFTKSNSTGGSDMKWQCIFLPDNGALFINYVTTCALVGTGLEIMRFPELFMYVFRLCAARSIAELASVRRAILYEFMFGVNYGWMLLVFALTMSFSVICPLITPFGLFYMIMKHGVDRYNIYFAYKRSKINKNIHSCAINCVIISLLLQQLILLFFNTIRASDHGLLPPRAIFSITLFTIFAALFLVQMFLGMFQGVSPIQYVKRSSRRANGPDDSHNSSGTSTPNSSHNSHRLHRRQKFVPDVLFMAD